MSRLTNAFHNDYTLLCMLRDELALQTSLFKADLKDRWRDLEGKLDVLREHVGRAEAAADHALPQIEASARIMLDTLRSGYSDIKRAVTP
ncbi:MAG: hypothetical protein OSA97_00300 [Nevskia sp.]|nr:hypothetical protein [Nevskia sp.]